MQSATFTFRKRKVVNGQEIFQDNYINPLNVISYYWDINEQGVKVLNVYCPTYTFCFVEKLGQRFVEHMEDFLRAMLMGVEPVVGGSPATYNNNRNAPAKTTERHQRRPIETEEISEDGVPAATVSWEQA